MKGRVTTWDKKSYDLPVLVEWELRYTGGVPCDSFSVTCAYEAGMGKILPECSRFGAFVDGQIQFYGVVDEYVAERSDRGDLLTVTGRGLAALLLDNEATAAVYQRATTQELLRTYVTPFGITCRQWKDLSGPYQVSSGSSQWKALEGFTRVYGGFTPRFTPVGELIAAPEQPGKRFWVGDGSPILSLVKREKRYGVLSEVLVVDKVRGVTHTARNEEFLRRGGSCRRVLYTPGQSTWSAMRYTGEYQIAQSAQDAVEIEVTLQGSFLAWPGDQVILGLTEAGLGGTYRVHEALNACGSDGETCRLTLRKE